MPFLPNGVNKNLPNLDLSNHVKQQTYCSAYEHYTWKKSSTEKFCFLHLSNFFK